MQIYQYVCWTWAALEGVVQSIRNKLATSVRGKHVEIALSANEGRLACGSFRYKLYCVSCTSCQKKQGWRGTATYTGSSKILKISGLPYDAHGQFDRVYGARETALNSQHRGAIRKWLEALPYVVTNQSVQEWSSNTTGHAWFSLAFPKAIFSLGNCSKLMVSIFTQSWAWLSSSGLRGADSTSGTRSPCGPLDSDEKSTLRWDGPWALDAMMWFSELEILSDSDDVSMRFSDALAWRPASCMSVIPLVLHHLAARLWRTDQSDGKRRLCLLFTHAWLQLIDIHLEQILWGLFNHQWFLEFLAPHSSSFRVDDSPNPVEKWTW